MAASKQAGRQATKQASKHASKQKGDGKRAHKVGEAVRAELMSLLLTGEVHDPAVANALVSSVVLTDDLRLAKVYVRLVDVDAGPAPRKALLVGLERAKGFLRREVAQRLSLRYAPDLRFYWDESIDRGRELEALLSDIKKTES